MHIVAELQRRPRATHSYVQEFKNALELLEIRSELQLTIKADHQPPVEPISGIYVS